MATEKDEVFPQPREKIGVESNQQPMFLKVFRGVTSPVYGEKWWFFGTQRWKR
jgi:hypothetical protein